MKAAKNRLFFRYFFVFQAVFQATGNTLKALPQGRFTQYTKGLKAITAHNFSDL